MCVLYICKFITNRLQSKNYQNNCQALCPRMKYDCAKNLQSILHLLQKISHTFRIKYRSKITMTA